jgi:hypothetical protein
MASPFTLMVEASVSAVSRKVSVTVALRATIASVTREPVSSSLVTTSLPRRVRSSTRDSPVARRVSFTSSARVAMLSAMRPPVSISTSAISWAFSAMPAVSPVVRCVNPSATWSSREDRRFESLSASSPNSSLM